MKISVLVLLVGFAAAEPQVLYTSSPAVQVKTAIPNSVASTTTLSNHLLPYTSFSHSVIPYTNQVFTNTYSRNVIPYSYQILSNTSPHAVFPYSVVNPPLPYVLTHPSTSADAKSRDKRSAKPDFDDDDDYYVVVPYRTGGVARTRVTTYSGGAVGQRASNLNVQGRTTVAARRQTAAGNTFPIRGTHWLYYDDDLLDD